MGNIKVGVCEWALPSLGPYSVQLSSELGFEGLQLADLNGYSFQYPMNNKHIQEAYMDYAQRYNQTLASMHMRSLFQDKTVLGAPGTALSDQCKLTIRKDIEACAAMGIPVVMATAIVPKGDEDAFRNAAAHMKYGCEVAADNGVIFTLETNMLNDEIYRMQEITGDGMKICFDTCNPYIYNLGVSPMDLWSDMMAHDPNMIEHYHVKDTKTEDFLIGRPAPCKTGEGGSHLDITSKLIVDSGFSGWVVSEVYFHAKPLNDGGDFFRLAQEDAQIIRSLFKK